MNLFGHSQEKFYMNVLYFVIIPLRWITSLPGSFCVLSLSLSLSFHYIFLDWISRSIWKQCSVQLSSVYGEVKTLAESLVCDPQTRPSCAVHVRCPPGIWPVSFWRGSWGTGGGEETLNSKSFHYYSIEQESSDSCIVFHYSWTIIRN